jgi:hypothetical protein
MNMKNIFRGLLFAPVLLLMIYYFLPSVEYLWLSCDELSLLEADGYNAILPKNSLIFIVYMIILLLISTAMFFFIKVARIIYAVFVFISMMLLVLIGNRMSAPVENVVVFLMTLSVGAVLALMYSESTRVLFDKVVELDKETDEDEEDDLP